LRVLLRTTSMRARIANIPARVWGLIALPLAVLAGPIMAVLVPIIVKAVVPQTVRVVLSLL
jgi:hypothetical protein